MLRCRLLGGAKRFGTHIGRRGAGAYRGGRPPTACYYGRTLSDASMLYFADVFFLLIFFMRTLVGETAERIFTKLSHVVDIRCYLRTY